MAAGCHSAQETVPFLVTVGARPHQRPGSPIRHQTEVARVSCLQVAPEPEVTRGFHGTGWHPTAPLIIKRHP